MCFALDVSVGSAAVLSLLSVFTNMSGYPIPFKDSSEMFISCYHVHTLSDSLCSVKEAGEHTFLHNLRMIGEEK